MARESLRLMTPRCVCCYRLSRPLPWWMRLMCALLVYATKRVESAAKLNDLAQYWERNGMVMPTNFRWFRPRRKKRALVHIAIMWCHQVILNRWIARMP